MRVGDSHAVDLYEFKVGQVARRMFLVQNGHHLSHGGSLSSSGNTGNVHAPEHWMVNKDQVLLAVKHFGRLEHLEST